MYLRPVYHAEYVHLHIHIAGELNIVLLEFHILHTVYIPVCISFVVIDQLFHHVMVLARCCELHVFFCLRRNSRRCFAICSLPIIADESPEGPGKSRQVDLIILGFSCSLRTASMSGGSLQRVISHLRDQLLGSN